MKNLLSLLGLKKYTIDDIPDHEFNPVNFRGKVNILVVDNEPFDLETTLRQMGFNLNKVDQWNNIKDAEPYHIIVSDNRGVCPGMGNGVGGIYILKQIQKAYPEKGLVAFSDSTIDLDRSMSLAGIKQLKKYDDVSDWTELLDEVIAETLSPRNLWLKYERKVAENGFSRKTLREMEHLYVKSILNRKSENQKIQNLISQSDVNTVELLVKIVGIAIDIAKLLQMHP